MMKKEKKIRKTISRCGVAAMICMLGLGTAGCSSVVEESDSIVIVEHKKRENVYALVVATVNDVIKTQTVRCTYRQVKDENISFPSTEKKVEAVYVKIGDTVKKGQLLAELEGGDRQDEIDELEYRIARNKLLLSYTDINENFDKSQRWWSYVYQSSGSDAETEKLNNSLADMEQSYKYAREDYQDAIDLDTLKLNTVKEEVANGRIYAGMDGEISYLKPNMVGEVAPAGVSVITIIDSSVCLFETKDAKYKDYFKTGEIVQMSLGYGKDAEVVEALPYDIASWDDKMLFEILMENESPSIEVGDVGVITLELAKSEQVLSIPKASVHTADGKEYVYVLGENNIREIRWIETGLYGDTLVEVVSGLTEGESIILR